MKYLLIIGDGMADHPVPALGNKTPLEAAEIPTLDALARAGTLGKVRTVPRELPPGSDTAILSILGCDTARCYSGRAPLEAAAQGIFLKPGDAAYRCNNVSLSPAPGFGECRIVSHSAGLSDDSGRRLIEDLFAHPDFAPLAREAGLRVHPTDSYRHIVVQTGADNAGLVTAPPHDHLGEAAGPLLPAGCENAAVLTKVMERAWEILDRHPINAARREAGLLPANGIWLWAQGTAAALPDFREQFGRTGAVVSAVPLCHGIAALLGLETPMVEGATGELDTNYAGKVEATLAALTRHDFAAVHLEAPDECTHNGDLPGKIEAIQRLDRQIVAPLLSALRERGEPFRVLVLSDHLTLTADGSHNGEPVPFLLYDSREDKGGSGGYSEEDAEHGPFLEAGAELLPLLFAQ